jgi:hypothetical protein
MCALLGPRIKRLEEHLAKLDPVENAGCEGAKELFMARIEALAARHDYMRPQLSEEESREIRAALEEKVS